MDPKIKADWLKALRSGKYKQCQGALAKDAGYCCLGVLYDIAADGWWLWRGDVYETSIGNKTAILPMRVLIDAKLARADEEPLTRMNDDGCTFPEIADWIEHNL